MEVLDGDEVRENLSKGLGFSKEDRDTNIRRIGFVAKLLSRNGTVAITAAISPYREVRDEMRAAIGRFVEVYVECPIDVLQGARREGLYKKALAGEIKHFTGVDDPYEPPLKPEVLVQSDKESVDESVGPHRRDPGSTRLHSPRAGHGVQPGRGGSHQEPAQGSRLHLDLHGTQVVSAAVREGLRGRASTEFPTRW